MPKLAVALMAVFVMIRPLPGALKMLGDREKEEEALLHSFFWYVSPFTFYIVLQ